MISSKELAKLLPLPRHVCKTIKSKAAAAFRADMRRARQEVLRQAEAEKEERRKIVKKARKAHRTKIFTSLRDKLLNKAKQGLSSLAFQAYSSVLSTDEEEKALLYDCCDALLGKGTYKIQGFKIYPSNQELMCHITWDI